MAKKQTFGDKSKKQGLSDFKVAKLIFSVKSDKSNAWKFVEKNVRIPNGENEQQILTKAIGDHAKH
ncbi:MAG: hypothetical protein HGA62_07745 [Chlorobiaceae bacterium]|nr:hypothetical protein [Chlorobiaceae bacterium]NTV61871.1 hypothetical protein [Chlorobiaceae bacterium]